MIQRFLPFVVVALAALLGGWFLQEGVRRDRGVFIEQRLFEEVVDRIADQYVDEVPREEVYRAAVEGLLDELGDPHSSLIEARDYEDFRIRTQGDYGGVGLEVVERDDRVTVVGLIPGTPGARSGIRPGDWFVAVEDESAEGLDVDGVVDRLRGPAGEPVRVRMGRAGVEQPVEFTLQREVIRIRSVPFTELLPGDVGYVPLQIFRSTSTDEVRAAVDSLVSEGASRLVLDLRGNPGGLLEEGIGVTQLFLGADRTVVETRGRGMGQSESYGTEAQAEFPRIPIAVLVDGSSASASEIVAGALQDHDRALVVGMSTYGKGSVQTLFPLSAGNVLRLTTALWYTPVGRSIDRELAEGTSVLNDGAIGVDGGWVARPDTAGRPEFRSMGGRVLRGGGGIVPDELVQTDTLTTLEAQAVRTLFRQGGSYTQALFDFAVEFQGERPDLDEEFELRPSDLERFRGRLEAAGIDITPQVFDDARRFIETQLEREIALQAFGDAAVFRRVWRDDRVLVRALEQLETARATRDLLTRPNAA